MSEILVAPKNSIINKRLFTDRKRTNILRSAEQKTISLMVKKIPSFITPNILTVIGTAGCLLVLGSFMLATYDRVEWLLLGVVGLIVNWFGDSLDGRLAYYRNIPRKWFGFALDIVMDWIGTAMIGLGYFIYADDYAELFAFGFVVLYAWAMMISQLRYKITDKYTIDSGMAGPTEVRVLIAGLLIVEVLYPHSIHYFAALICAALFIINTLETKRLLKQGDIRDWAEKELKKKTIHEYN